MRFLLDECIPAEVATRLARAGHDAQHVAGVGMSGARDVEVLARAAAERRILVSADTDFGDLLARCETARPSVIIDRRRLGRRPEEQAARLDASAREVDVQLRRGAIAVLEDGRTRVRALPDLDRSSPRRPAGGEAELTAARATPAPALAARAAPARGIGRASGSGR